MDEDEPEHPEDNMSEQNQEDGESMELDFPASNTAESKRSKGELESTLESSPGTSHRAELHFPVQDQPGCACLVKV